MHPLIIRDNENQSATTLLNLDELSHIYHDYKKSKKRLILLDYDGTLVPFTDDPQMALPSADLLQTLSLISRNTKNKVVIISNRNKENLDTWLGHLNIDLIAENNTWIKSDGCWIKNTSALNEWKLDTIHILKILSKNLLGSWIEEKDCSIIWHYRFLETDDAERVVDLIIEHLASLNIKSSLIISKESKSIEITSVDKNISTNYFIRNNIFDFMLAIGEDFSNSIEKNETNNAGIPIKVGKDNLETNYYMENRDDVIKIINLLFTNENTMEKYPFSKSNNGLCDIRGRFVT